MGGDLEELRREVDIARARCAKLYRLAPVALVTLDRSGIVREVNSEAVAFLGASAKELLARAFSEQVVASDVDRLREHLEAVGRTESPITIELSLRAPNDRPVVVRLRSITSDGGEILTALLGPSEHRRAEEQVMSFLDRAAPLFRAMMAPRAVIDQVPSVAVPLLADLCVVQLYCGDEELRHTASSHVEPDDARLLESLERGFTLLPGIQGYVRRALDSGSPQLVELFSPMPAAAAALREPSAMYDVAALRQLQIKSLIVIPLANRGQSFGVVLLATVAGRSTFRPFDLPLAVELGRRVSLAIDNGQLFVELQQAIQAKDDFIAVLSHELRTPLTPVLAAVTAVLAKGREESPERFAMLEMIQRNVELERRLIDDLLDVSRIAKARLELNLEPIDLHSIVALAVDICRHDIERKRIALSMRLVAAKHHLLADPARIEQVVWNLLKNAIKFTPEGGSIEVGSENHDDSIDLEVIDSGIGIEGKDLSRIFNAFTQGDAPVGLRFGGLGLGLAISKSIVEAHGGVIRASSQGRGRGSKFTFELPGASAAARPSQSAQLASSASQASTASSTPIRVLLVEDDADTLEVTSSLLRESKYDVSTADTFALALDKASHGSFDVLVSDINLPDGTGLDLMRTLRSSGNPVQGIALSGLGTHDDVDRSRRAGFLVHLTKPITFPALQSAIGEAVRSLAAPA